MLFIPQTVAFQLGQPVFRARFGKARNLAGRIWMLMPEAAMHKNHLAPADKSEVWLSRKLFPVQAVAESLRINQPPHDPFRLGVLAPDAPHVLAARDSHA